MSVSIQRSSIDNTLLKQPIGAFLDFVIIYSNNSLFISNIVQQNTNSVSLIWHHLAEDNKAHAIFNKSVANYTKTIIDDRISLYRFQSYGISGDIINLYKNNIVLERLDSTYFDMYNTLYNQPALSINGGSLETLWSNIILLKRRTNPNYDSFYSSVKEYGIFFSTYIDYQIWPSQYKTINDVVEPTKLFVLLYHESLEMPAKKVFRARSYEFRITLPLTNEVRDYNRSV
jgi:hypothetical protein